MMSIHDVISLAVLTASVLIMVLAYAMEKDIDGLN